MNVSTAIKSRRAIKAFDPSHRISKDETEQLMSLALLSPNFLQHSELAFLDSMRSLSCDVRYVR